LGDKQVLRVVEEFAGCSLLFDQAVPHHGQCVAQAQRFFHPVADVNEGRLQPRMKLVQPAHQLAAGVR